MDESKRTPGGGEPSGTNNQQPSPPAPASQHPETGNPQPATTIGYPATAMGYPAPDQRGIPAPYPGYPNASNYNQNLYMQSQPQPETYYTYPNYTTRTEDDNMGIARALIMCMILSVIFSCIGSIIMYFVSRNQIPVFRMVSFSVSNFNVSNDRFSSVWDANVTMENRFRNADFHFEHVQSIVYFHDDLLAVSSVEQYVNSITIRKNEKGTIPGKVTVNDSKLITPEPDKKVIEGLRNQRKDNYISFSFKMYLWTGVKEDLWRTRHWKIGIVCTDVKVEFENQDSSNGNFKGNSQECDSLT